MHECEPGQFSDADEPEAVVPVLPPVETADQTTDPGTATPTTGCGTGSFAVAATSAAQPGAVAAVTPAAAPVPSLSAIAMEDLFGEQEGQRHSGGWQAYRYDSDYQESDEEFWGDGDNPLHDLEDLAASGRDLTKRYQSWQQGPNANAAPGAGPRRDRHAEATVGGGGGGHVTRVRVEAYSGPKLKDAVANKVVQANRKTDASKIRTKDKADRATTEQVLDPRTRMFLFKMLNRGIFAEMNGCISTGKEANVYHASGTAGAMDLAIKVFKTSILVFKDRGGLCWGCLGVNRVDGIGCFVVAAMAGVAGVANVAGVAGVINAIAVFPVVGMFAVGCSAFHIYYDWVQCVVDKPHLPLSPSPPHPNSYPHPQLIPSPPWYSAAPATDRYVTGEFRFRKGYSKGNPRKMVKLWAEKEFRNLSRLRSAGIRCPKPVHLRAHVRVKDCASSSFIAQAACGSSYKPHA